MKKTWPVGVILATATISSACHADAIMSGAGTFTCGKFASDYAKHPEIVEDLYFAWAQGFMSGLNLDLASGVVNGQKQFRDLDGPIENQKSKIRIYCNAHPLAPFMDAVFDLIRSQPLKNMP
jgi:hypothetical protein